MEIRPIRIPRSQIRDLPPSITSSTPPPVVRGIDPPVIDIPSPLIDYPTIDVPTEQDFRDQLQQPQSQQQEPEEPGRSLPPPTPTVDLPVVGEVPLPPVGPLVAAGATAVVVATVTMGSTILLSQMKTALEPALKRMTTPKTKKKKIKIKQKKPVLHYIQSGDKVNIYEYGTDKSELVDSVDDIEKYIRDQVEDSSLYEFDNNIVIDENLRESFTKEGQKRFKKHFCPSKSIVKKLSAKFSF